MGNAFKIICILSILACLGGCFSPAYVRPEMPSPMPETFKHTGEWKPANPADTLDKGTWWTLFKDPALDALMTELRTANQKIARAAANYRQARAQIGSARASFLPTVDASGSMTRQGDSTSAPTGASYSTGVSAKWEVTLWNSIPAYEAAVAMAEASAADYAAMRLAMEAELAQTYFSIRSLDGQISLYESTIAAYAKAVQLTRSQYQGGLATPADVAQAETQLASAEAQLMDLQQQRDMLETTIAILTGNMPSSFSLARASLMATLPHIPASIPSTLLERRPDIAASERRVAAANEQIGMARAAWFPSVTLSADRALKAAAGFMTAPLTVWSFGPTAALSLFQGGKRLAEGDAAKAGYEVSVATYRQTVLEGFKEVEDNLSALSNLAKQADAQNRAVSASQMALRLSLSQYQSGMTTYLQVVNTQTAALTNERSALQVEQARLTAAVNLIKALGGGWDQASFQALTANSLPMEGTLP